MLRPFRACETVQTTIDNPICTPYLSKRKYYIYGPTHPLTPTMLSVQFLPLPISLKPTRNCPNFTLKCNIITLFCNIITIRFTQNDGNFGHMKQIKTRFVWSLGAFAVISW